MKSKTKSVLQPPAVYSEISDCDKPSKVNDILQPYVKYFKSPLVKWGAIKKGLRSGALSDLLQISGAKQNELSGWLSITEPTLRKFMQDKKALNLGLSEHLIQLFELYDKGIDTFGSVAEFKSWLKHYNIGIDAVPADMLDTITGISIVMNELRRIDYGILA